MNYKELRAFLGYLLLRPRLLPGTFRYYPTKIYDKVLPYFGGSRQSLYPEYIKSLYKGRFLSNEKTGVTINYKRINARQSPVEREYRDPIDDTVLLAYGEASLEEFLNSWQMHSQDKEQLVSLHRWNWLLTKLTSQPSPEIGNWGIQNVYNWVSMNMDEKKLPVWETYTTGERICNVLLFWILLRDKKELNEIPDWLLNALSVMAKWVAYRLEYNADGHIFNHVLCNGRALYFYGRSLNVSSYQQIAYMIFYNELPKLVTSEGFLRESSSHYHYLFTRWILEIYWLAEITEDKKVKELIQPVARVLVKNCYFFLVTNNKKQEYDIPLIGDVSPDFPPSWLINLPWSKPALSCYRPDVIHKAPKPKGWGNLFGVVGGNTLTSYDRKEFKAFPESGWYRLDWNELTLFWHIEKEGIPLVPGHGHCDTGSFSLYIKGVPVIIDPGRYSYTSEKLGMYGKLARSHNNIVIDGYEPFLYDKRYPSFYRKSKVKVNWQEEDDFFKFSISHEGFYRIMNDKILFNRTFNITDNKIEIVDTFHGKLVHNIETYFQWAPDITTRKGQSENEYLIFADAGLLKFAIRNLNEQFAAVDTICGDSILPAGWFFAAYGRKEVSTTMGVFQKRKLPFVQKYTLEIRRP